MKYKGVFATAASVLALLQPHAALAQDQPAGTGGQDTPQVEGGDIVVTGSRIARQKIEGATPVTVILGDDIDTKGLRSVFDALATLSQNTGWVQGEDRGATFTPVANVVNLRGLGPNHSLVLVNGRRLADYPIAYNGQTNVVNLANIPSAFIDTIEVATGSAGAVYGSDAIAGVVNMKLKEKANGLDIDLRAGNTDEGGGRNIRGQTVGGVTLGRLDLVFGGEISSRDPIFYGQRDVSNSYSRYSTAASPLSPPSMFSITNPSTRAYTARRRGRAKGCPDYRAARSAR